MKKEFKAIPKEEILANRSNPYKFIVFDSIDYVLFDFNFFEQTAKWHKGKFKNK